MNRRLILLALVVGLFSLILVASVTLNDVAFSDGSTTHTAELTAATNYTIYIDIPKAYIHNVTINLKGVE